MGVLLREKHSLQQLYSRMGVGLFLRLGLLSRSWYLSLSTSTNQFILLPVQYVRLNDQMHQKHPPHFRKANNFIMWKWTNIRVQELITCWTPNLYQSMSFWCWSHPFVDLGFTHCLAQSYLSSDHDNCLSYNNTHLMLNLNATLRIITWYTPRMFREQLRILSITHTIHTEAFLIQHAVAHA